MTAPRARAYPWEGNGHAGISLLDRVCRGDGNCCRGWVVLRREGARRKAPAALTSPRSCLWKQGANSATGVSPLAFGAATYPTSRSTPKVGLEIPLSANCGDRRVPIRMEVGSQERSMSEVRRRGHATVRLTWLPHWQAYVVRRQGRIVGMVRCLAPLPFRQPVEFA